MEIVSYTEFRSNLKYWLDKVVNDVSDIVIKRKSRIRPRFDIVGRIQLIKVNNVSINRKEPR